MQPVNKRAFSLTLPLLTLPLSLLLSACGNGSNHSETAVKDAQPTLPSVAPAQPSPAPTTVATSFGRLAIADANQASVNLIDLATTQTVADISLHNPASALYTSPQSGYVVAIQRKQNLVEFIDSGLNQTQPQAPSLHTFSITDAMPTHFDVSAQAAALFLDGDSAVGLNAGFQVLTDASIKQGKTIASHQFTQAMHGTTQLRGEFALTTLRSDANTTALPDKVVLLHQHGDHYHEEQTFAESCPGLHGSMQGPAWTVFGCEDGVLAVQQNGEQFTAHKIANPAAIGTARIGTLKGSHGHDKFLGLTRSQQAFLVDPVANSITEIVWRDNPETKFLAYAVDHHQHHFLVLDNLGYLGVYEIEHDFERVASIKVFDTAPVLAQGQKMVLTTSGSQDHVFIANQANNQIITVDLSDKAVINTLDLAFTPAHLAWVGTPQQPTTAHAH